MPETLSCIHPPPRFYLSTLQHSIALARAVEQEGDTSASLGILEDASTGATKLAGLGHELIELDQRLATARNDLLTVIKGNDRFLRRHGPSTKNEAASRAKEAAHAIEQQRDLMREDPQPSSDEKDVSVEAVTQRRSSLLHRAAQRRSTPPPNRVLESILRGEKTKPTYPSRNSSTVAVGKKQGSGAIQPPPALNSPSMAYTLKPASGEFNVLSQDGSMIELTSKGPPSNDFEPWGSSAPEVSQRDASLDRHPSRGGWDRSLPTSRQPADIFRPNSTAQPGLSTRESSAGRRPTMIPPPSSSLRRDGGASARPATSHKSIDSFEISL